MNSHLNDQEGDACVPEENVFWTENCESSLEQRG